ncbi:MAG: site-specific integrase [Armatimonadia bacterium]
MSTVGAPPGLHPLVQEFLQSQATVQGLSPNTLRASRGDLEQFLAYLRAQCSAATLETVQTRDVYGFCRWLGQERCPATVARKLSSLGSFFRYLQQTGVVEGNPVAGVPRPRVPEAFPQVPTEEDCRRLLGACATERERAVALLLLGCGLRRSELLGLNVGDVAADLSQITIQRGKGGKARAVLRPQTRPKEPFAPQHLPVTHA